MTDETASPDRPMTRAECEAMWKQVYKAERDRFKAERDEALAALGQLVDAVPPYIHAALAGWPVAGSHRRVYHAAMGTAEEVLGR